MQQPLDYERPPKVTGETPRFGVLSGLVTVWAALACLASIIALREGQWLAGAINLPIWGLLLLHQYRTYRRRVPPGGDDEAE